MNGLQNNHTHFGHDADFSKQSTMEGFIMSNNFKSQADAISYLRTNEIYAKFSDAQFKKMGDALIPTAEAFLLNEIKLENRVSLEKSDTAEIKLQDVIGGLYDTDNNVKAMFSDLVKQAEKSVSKSQQIQISEKSDTVREGFTFKVLNKSAPKNRPTEESRIKTELRDTLQGALYQVPSDCMDHLKRLKIHNSKNKDQGRVRCLTIPFKHKAENGKVLNMEYQVDFGTVDKTK